MIFILFILYIKYKTLPPYLFLKAIGINDKELEGILGIKTWAISERFCVFGTDFETTMRDSFQDYLQVEAINIELLGSSSKNLIARETAKLITLSEESEGKTQLTKLIECIKDLRIF